VAQVEQVAFWPFSFVSVMLVLFGQVLVTVSISIVTHTLLELRNVVVQMSVLVLVGLQHGSPASPQVVQELGGEPVGGSSPGVHTPLPELLQVVSQLTVLLQTVEHDCA
jgi:hypothetical protein